MTSCRVALTDGLDRSHFSPGLVKFRVAQAADVLVSAWGANLQNSVRPGLLDTKRCGSQA
jgi:hypothetical protein